MNFGHALVFLFVFLILPFVSYRLMNRIGFFGVVATIVITVLASQVSAALLG